MIEIMNKLWRAQKQLTQELGREPTPEEIADEMHMPVARINSLLKMAQQPISLARTGGRRRRCERRRFHRRQDRPRTRRTSPATVCSRTSLGDVLTSLTERERRILEMRFGLVDGYERTLEEIGKITM